MVENSKNNLSEQYAAEEGIIECDNKRYDAGPPNDENELQMKKEIKKSIMETHSYIVHQISYFHLKVV